MGLDTLTDNDVWKTAASIVTGGAFVGWYRERRRGKKDAYVFAMDLITQQSVRIDALVGEVAELKAKFAVESDTVEMLRRENEHLKSECDRLKTALGEQNRMTGGRNASAEVSEGVEEES